MNKKSLEQLKIDEGFSKKVYFCTANHHTIGYGYNLDANPLNLSSAEITFIFREGMSTLSAERLLLAMVAVCEKELATKYSWFAGLDDARHGAITNMVYNLGINRFAGFKKFIAAMSKGDYKKAAAEGLDSLWADQVGDRANRLMAQIADN